MDIDEFDDLKIILWLILFLLFGIVIITCKHDSGDYIMTVNGPVPSMQTGMTLEHEHILVDFIGADSTGYFRWDRKEVITKALPHIRDIKNRGINTFIECTPAYLGRDPLLLKDLSDQTGLNFITNTGYYGARNNLYVPESFYSSGPEQIAEIWVKEFETGIEDTGIRPGFIKIAVDPADMLSPEHRKIITAAALAHLKTGLTIASHTGPEKPAFEQISILKEYNVHPSAFIWVHAQRGTIESNIAAAKEGTWISLDNVRARADLTPGAPNSINWYADRILGLKKEGLLGKVLISHDSGWYDPAKPEGGTFSGFTDISDFLIPALREKGLTDSDIDQLLVKNPQKAFTVKIRTLNSER
jgi:phosphotriesterase-related protein